MGRTGPSCYKFVVRFPGDDEGIANTLIERLATGLGPSVVPMNIFMGTTLRHIRRLLLSKAVRVTRLRKRRSRTCVQEVRGGANRRIVGTFSMGATRSVRGTLGDPTSCVLLSRNNNKAKRAFS